MDVLSSRRHASGKNAAPRRWQSWIMIKPDTHLEKRNQFLIAKNAPASHAWNFIKKLIATDGRYRDVFRIARHFIETPWNVDVSVLWYSETVFREHNSGAVLRPFVEGETMLAEFSRKQSVYSDFKRSRDQDVSRTLYLSLSSVCLDKRIFNILPPVLSWWQTWVFDLPESQSNIALRNKSDWIN